MVAIDNGSSSVVDLLLTRHDLALNHPEDLETGLCYHRRIGPAEFYANTEDAASGGRGGQHDFVKEGPLHAALRKQSPKIVSSLLNRAASHKYYIIEFS